MMIERPAGTLARVASVINLLNLERIIQVA
jgi:hypothetical protein